MFRLLLLLLLQADLRALTRALTVVNMRGEPGLDTPCSGLSPERCCYFRRGTEAAHWRRHISRRYPTRTPVRLHAVAAAHAGAAQPG